MLGVQCGCQSAFLAGPPVAFHSYLSYLLAMSVLHRAIYPTEAVMASWTTMTHVRTWAAVPDDEWEPIATALGDRNLDSILLVGAMPPHLLTTVLAAWISTSAATPLSQLRMAMLVNAARLKLGMDLVDVLPGPAGTNPMSTAASSGDTVPHSGVLATTGAVKVKLSQVVDQGSNHKEVVMLQVSELKVMRHHHVRRPAATDGGG